ncbi:MAG: ribonuclease J [Bacilli bacterium]
MNKPNNKKKSNNNPEIKVYSLGGLGVVGMNMYVVESKNEIIIMDAGILFADDDQKGVNYIIPDFTYLINNQSRIVALFITHGHEDHIGALPFLLQKVNIPVIYATGIALGLIKNKMQEFPHIQYNLQAYNDNSEFVYNDFKVSFFRTNHSIPDSYGIAIKTIYGYIVNTGDFKFDFSPIGEKCDYYKMTKLGKEGVLCLLSDSTNADIARFSSSERKIGENLNNLFNQIKGRIIVATFASNVYRVQQILEASINSNRDIVVFGHSMEKTIEVASKLKYINVPKARIHYGRDLGKLDTKNVTILCTGSQGEPLAALSKIAKGTHKQIKLLPNDTVIFSSKPIPGNEQFINRNINMLVHAGAHVIKNSPLTDTHTTGHASQNEIRLMLSFMQPRYFMPVHGEYSMLKQHANLAMSIGIPKENCFVLEAGDSLCFNSRGAKVIKNDILASDIYLDSSFSDIDSNILKERKKMSDDGLVTITFSLSKDKKLIYSTKVITRGFMDPALSNDFCESIREKADDILLSSLNSYKNINIKHIMRQITINLSQVIYRKTERNPLIVPIINIIN